MPTKKSELPGAQVRLDAGNDTYEIGAELDGVWITFATVHGAQVRAIQVNAAENAAKTTEGE